MGLSRGDIAITVLSGDYGKPRAVVVLQSDLFHAIDSVVVVPFTSDRRPIPALFRISVEPSPDNNLRVASDIMVDKLSAIPRARAGEKIGYLKADEMAELTAAVALFLGF